MKTFYEFVTESLKELPLAKMSLKAAHKDTKAHGEKDIKKKTKLENQGRMIRIAMDKADKSK